MTTIAKRPQELIDTMTQVRTLLSRSAKSLYAESEPTDIIAILDTNIQTLSENGSYSRGDLILLFAPTGDIQDTSIENGWGEQFIALSEKFDKLVESK